MTDEQTKLEKARGELDELLKNMSDGAVEEIPYTSAMSLSEFGNTAESYREAAEAEIDRLQKLDDLNGKYLKERDERFAEAEATIEQQAEEIERLEEWKQGILDDIDARIEYEKHHNRDIT